MKSMFGITGAFAGIRSAPDSQAFWVLGCAKPVVVERADPIMYPGVPSEHLHTIMGGDAFDLAMDYRKTQTSDCTTCGVTKDLSNYWVPTVYFHAENGSFISVEQVGGINVYYQERMDWTEYCAGKTLQPFPKEFRMIAGDRLRRSFSRTSLDQQAVEFICLLTNGETGLPPYSGFPDRPCPGGLQIRIRFPSCWDGKSVDSPDHRSHVRYPSGIDNGLCPKTHPVRIPALLHLRKPGDQPFVLSQGDPTGFGYHADFLNGWDIELLEKAIRDPTCGNASGGRIDFCETFQPFLQNNRVQNLCPSIPSKVNETAWVWGPASV
ncbi:hypothetical protein B0H67DRAFT_603039 [Lasiosphaeris hirsuta]|uniref:DUF1996 domain-containing protein n=1 Tax=Lasiosphaeris hirsuta TaxID=260670 RepID=A0AA40A217_9PEZI|nr:hypothetical protein B0H67DRAFT_603039 [Lasiosphaeris hirsuta]